MANRKKDKDNSKRINQEKNDSVNQDKATFNISKYKNFSEWYTEILKKAEIVDIRYNIKGFLVHQPWSVLAVEKMYRQIEKALQKKGHLPYFFPTLIPESNLKKEASHISKFTPEVFWVTHGGNTKFEERLALRPTSETAFYQMFSLWIRSYKDLPFKTYQRAQVFRHDTKATRPLLRDREFYWIEAHNVFATMNEAEKQAAEKQLSSCESSDWFWWFGDYNPSHAVESFDRLYRHNLMQLYRLLKLPVPANLNYPISHGGSGTPEAGGAMRRST